MWPRTSCPLSRVTRNIVLGRASVISPSISIFSSLPTSRRLDGGYVHRLRALRPILGFVRDPCVLLERLEAAPLDTGVMDEEIAAALVRRDEAEALLVVEPLDGSGSHALKHLSLCALLGALRSPNYGTSSL